MIYEHYSSGEIFYTPEAIAAIYEMYEKKGLGIRLQWIHEHFSELPNFADIKTTLESSKIPNKEIGIANFLNTNPRVFYPALEVLGYNPQKVEFYVSCYNNGTDILAKLVDEKKDTWLTLESKTTNAHVVPHFGNRAPARGKNFVKNRIVECKSQIKLHPTGGNYSKDELVKQILQKYFHDCALFFTHYRGPETNFEEVYPDIIFLDKETFNDIIMLHYSLGSDKKYLSWDGKTINLSIPSFYNKYSNICTVLQTLHP